MVSYKPLVQRLAARKEERAHAQKALHEAHDVIAGSISKARTTNRWAKKEEGHHFANAARGTLNAARGFTCNPGTTADRYGRTKVVPHRNDKGPMSRTGTAAMSRTGTAMGTGQSMVTTGRVSRKVSKSSVNVGLPARRKE